MIRLGRDIHNIVNLRPPHLVLYLLGISELKTFPLESFIYWGSEDTAYP